MLALLSIWIGVGALLLSLFMAVRPGWFTDVWLTVCLYTAVLSLTFAGMTLWALRKEPGDDPGVAARRIQCKTAIVVSLAAITIAYVLVARLARPPA